MSSNTNVSLPIDPLLPDVVARLDDGPALVLEAPPGAGKTTRVPRALLEARFAARGEILVLQPRRLPARLAAERVAEEMGQRPGETVGYSVRFEDVAGPHTRLRFVTEGVLTRRLLSDPRLEGVAAVVLDEFHERHLATDLALALLRRLQRGARPDLRVCVMSATLDAAPIAEYLGDCPRLRSEGRRFDVSIEHAAQPDDRPLADQIAGAVRRLAADAGGTLDGDVLVFLPGAGEIRRAADALQPLASSRGWLVLPLHGELPLGEQNRAVRPADRPKIVLSTNVAETSVTIDGVVAVIDAGLARLASFSPWTGMPTLRVGKISQASAIQRAGRAGRTRPGRALRLYTRHDFDSRRPYDAPEIERLDLAEPLLALAALGVRDVGAFDWFERPPTAAVAAGTELLRATGALDGAGALTEIGRQMLRFPVHPRLARLLVEAERRGVGPEAAALAALLSERDVRERARVSFGKGRDADDGDADLLALYDRFEQARRTRFARDELRGLGLDGRATEAAERARKQLARLVRDGAPRPSGPDAVDAALALATLAAFPDRVGKRRAGGREIVLANGGAAAIGATPAGEWLVAVDAEERAPGPGRGGGGVAVRLAVPIEPEALLDVAPQSVSDTDALAFNPDTARVERTTRLAYGALALEETRRPAEPSAEASRLLVGAAKAAGPDAFLPAGALDGLRVRLGLLAEALPEAGLPKPAAGSAAGDDVWERVLAAACEGRVSFAELREADLVAEYLGHLPGAARELLRVETPERVRLPGGREVKVNYEPDRPPWIESRLQDFFGMAQGPTICRGRVPLTIHLLAPNHRAVQVTRDLASFWKQHYPPLRRELGRRYPRHAWPEDGATASPPPPKPPRPR